MGEGLSPGETLGQFYRVTAIVFVVDGDGRVGHFQRCGEGKQQHLNQNRHNQNGARLRFAQQRLQLFTNQGP